MKVLIDDLVYQVRYLGIKTPEDENYAQMATFKNGEHVYLKEITLIGDGIDKDPVGRLLRYVTVDDKFVNLELIHQGYALVDETMPASACAQVFESAEEDARTAQRGIWK